MRELSCVTAFMSSALAESRPPSSLKLLSALPPSRSTCATDSNPDKYEPCVTSRTLLPAPEPIVEEPGLFFGAGVAWRTDRLELYNLACCARSANLRLPDRMVHSTNTVSTLHHNRQPLAS